MTERRMHPDGRLYGEGYAQNSYAEIIYYPPDIPEEIGVFITVVDSDADNHTSIEIPKATFDKFIAEYLSAYGETWIG